MTSHPGLPPMHLPWRSESDSPWFPATVAHRERRTVVPDQLPWGSLPYDARGDGQRPTPGLPDPAVLRLQAFAAS